MTATATAKTLRDNAFAVAQTKLRRLLTDHPDRIPTYTVNGRWRIDEDPWAPTWTGGFLTGQLWLIADHTGDPWWLDQAKRYSRQLIDRRLDPGTHDIGFLFTPSWSRWRRLEDTPAVRDVLADAGRTMAARFNPAGQYLSTWVDPGSTFIDVMMNIDIIYEAAEITGDRDLADIATAHALTSRRYLVRGDGTTIHEGWFDPDDGQFLRSATHQGRRADSSWVRGHTWAIYGFGDAYRRTGDTRFLDTARLLADGYLDRSIDQLPPNDWNDPSTDRRIEASAAAIAASALARLADLCGPDGAHYREHAELTVNLLSDRQYLAAPNDNWDGVIKHATYHYNNGLGVDESVMWGDYYYLEAVDRLYPRSVAGS